MVLVGDKKYACETCIKGHRSSSCKHTDRPLFEIKKKGRPVTQCEHCRELRKTRQIHVKCVCENKDSNPGVSSSSLGQDGTMVSARAAFPSGLPEGLLEASVASRPLSEGSESDQGARGCACKDDASCNCWTPRSSAKRPARPAARRGSEARPTSTSPGEIISQPAALVIHAHSGNNRPVLPKPPATERPVSPTRKAPIQPPSAPLRGRSPIHGQSFYSPYGRAYEYAHGSETPYPPPPQSSASYSGGRDPTTSISPDASSPFDAWQDSEAFRTYASAPDPPPLCNCGSTCACPGCLEHNGPNANPSASCVNPNTCSACLECNIVALTALSSEITSSLYDPAQAQDVDRWLSQMSSMSDFAPASGSSNSVFSPSDSVQQEMRYDTSATQPYRTWNDPQAPLATSSFTSVVESECCGGRCKCPAGMCRCPPDCCGCCQGCSCPGCDHDRSSGRMLTFATSGERAPCCGGAGHQENHSSDSASSARQPQFANTRTLSSPSGGARYADGPWAPQLLTVPRETLSRASSLSSSKSSPNPSTSSSSPIPYGDPVDSVQTGRSSGVQSCCTSMDNLPTHAPGGGAAGSPPRPQFGGGQSQRGFEPHNSSGFPSHPGARRYS